MNYFIYNYCIFINFVYLIEDPKLASSVNPLKRTLAADSETTADKAVEDLVAKSLEAPNKKRRLVESVPLESQPGPQVKRKRGLVEYIPPVSQAKAQMQQDDALPSQSVGANTPSKPTVAPVPIAAPVEEVIAKSSESSSLTWNPDQHDCPPVDEYTRNNIPNFDSLLPSYVVGRILFNLFTSILLMMVIITLILCMHCMCLLCMFYQVSQ